MKPEVSVVIKKMYQQLTAKRWLQCYLLFFISACIGCSAPAVSPANSERDSIVQIAFALRAFDSIKQVEPLVRSGDLVTRTGNDFTSESFKAFNQRDQTYSHCGIASVENDTVFIYHALGGEFNPDQKIRRDPLQLFGEGLNNRGIGLFHYNFQPGQKDSLLAIVQQWYIEGLMFDMKFDLATNDRMYCAEFVYKALLKTTRNKLFIHISHIKDFKFVGVDDLYLIPECSTVKRIVYK